MTRPPRLAENVLASLGAQPEFRDAVLGDLAEELDLRATWDGERAARRWYYGEALRTAPYLVRDWVRGLRWRDARRLAGVVTTAYVFTVIIAVTALTVARVVMGTLGLTWTLESIGQRGAMPLAINFAIGCATAVLGGYIAGWLHERAPMAAALALGVAWSAVGLATITIVGTTPAWYSLLAPVMVIVGTLTGGALRAGNRGQRHVES